MTASSELSKKHLSSLLKRQGLKMAQWESFNDAQRQALIVAGANKVDVASDAFINLGAEPGVEFRDLSEDEANRFRAWARDHYQPNSPIDTLWHPVVQAECALMNDEFRAATGDAASSSNSTPPPDENKEPSVDDLGANTVGKRKSSGPRTGDAMGAKPLVRKLLGTANPDGTFPSLTMEQICHATKKSDVNIRTILSDLRSPKYCGSGGVFNTTSSKIDGKTYYQYKAEEAAPSA